MRVAFDMSSVMWTSLLVGQDPEAAEVEHDGRRVKVNTAAWGYEHAVNLINAALGSVEAVPNDMLLVFEGMNSKKRRLLISSDYKATRDSRPPEAYAEFEALAQMLKDAYLSLGAIALSQDSVEGDDVLAWLAQNTEEPLLIVSNDNDMAVLNFVNAYGAQVQARINGVVGENAYGPFPLPLITLYKSLVGDTKDNIKGCPGFGKQSFAALIGKYGEDGAFELLETIRDNKLDSLQDLDSCKLIAKIIENKLEVYKSYKLALLHPEWVENMQSAIAWQPGMVTDTVKDERLVKWRAQKRLVTAGNYTAALDFFQQKLAESPDVTFDIETSTPAESDEWLAAQGKPDGVDVLGSQLTGFSLTFGRNRQYTYYVSVDHRDTDNITVEQARVMLEAIPKSKQLVIQNTSFEGTVLYQTEDGGITWGERWAANGYSGFLPNWLDTKFEATYVDENSKTGLKDRSLMHLGYRQVSYDETVTKTGKEDELPSGGRLVSTNAETQELTVKYKMRELTAQDVFAYGTDDTICTAALHNFYKLHMQLEHHWQVYLDVEIGASYQHAKNFLDGVTFSLERMNELKAEDDKTYDQAWSVVRSYLFSHGWEGTVPPNYGTDITAAQIKQAFRIVTGLVEDEEDEAEAGVEVAATPEQAFLSTRVRTPAKLQALAADLGFDLFADMLGKCLEGKPEVFTKWVLTHFTGEPVFAISNKQMKHLMYEVMALPVRVRNKPTEAMRARGINEGGAKTDALAIEYALRDATEEQKRVLQSLKLMQMVKTRRGLYYSPYPYFIHWKTGKLHSSHNQCQTNTRRASEAAPNKQQLPKHPKIEGQEAKFRETITPHRPDAVVVSLDFESQELRVIADYSKDPNMVACYVGDNKKDMHALTGLGILRSQQAACRNWSYETFVLALGDKTHPAYNDVKQARVLGKKTNFTTEYGAAAPKLAATLLVSEEEAQKYIDAKEAAFPVALAWKQTVVQEAKRQGYVTTKLGARRHLKAALASRDPYTKSKAERQAVNFKIQSSSAEMTKLAEGRIWAAGLVFRFDAVCYGPIHDELVFSVALSDLLPFLQECHAHMVAPYADMEIPIGSSISFGPNFGVQFEIGNQPTAEAVANGLEQMEKYRRAQENHTKEAANV